MENFWKVRPWRHQEKVVELANECNVYGLFFQQGTGKTATAINFYRKKCLLEKRMLRLLVLCPPVVVGQWKEEFGKYSGIPQDKIICLTGSGIDRKAEYIKQNGFIYITNYETLLMKELFPTFLGNFDMVIFDESQKLKNPSSRRSKLAEKLADTAKVKLILTGTPILNSEMDIFQQFRVMDGGDTFGKNFFAFRAEYFYDENAGMPSHKHFPKWKPRPQTHKKLNDLIARKSTRVLKSECLDLPELVRQKLQVPLGKAQRKAYEEMLEDYLTFLEGKECSAQLALTKSLRLQQIVTGFIKFDDGTVERFDDNPRLDALYDQLSDICIDNKVIVWCNFSENYKMVAEVCGKLGLHHCFLNGEISGKERDANIEAFRKNPEMKVLIANPQAGGVGVNLVEASYSIWYSRSFRLEDDLQAEARNHRGGSEMHSKITRIDILSPGTIDEVILSALASKSNVASKLIEMRRA